MEKYDLHFMWKKSQTYYRTVVRLLIGFLTFHLRHFKKSSVLSNVECFIKNILRIE